MINVLINSSERIIKYDFLRGILSFLVVFHHMPDYWFNVEFILIFKKQLFLSVDYFFLLSGYLITSKYGNLSFNNVHIFIKKRFFRLYPLLIFTSILFCIALIFRYHLFNISNSDQIFIFSKSNYITSLFDNLFLSSSSTILGSLNLINTPSWSVSAEFVSYFIFSFQALFVKKFRIIFSTLSFFLLLYLLFLDNKIFSSTTYGFARGYIGFYIGGLILIIKQNINVSHYNLLFFSVFSSFIAIICSALLFTNFFTHLFIYLAIVFSFYCFTLLESDIKSTSVISKFCVFLGSISYSIYLNHYLIILIMDNLFGNTIKTVYLFLSTYLFVLLISYFTYKYIENKFRIFS